MAEEAKNYLLPLIPLRGLTVFPYMVIHFDVGRQKSIEALENAMINDQMIFLVTQKDAETEEPTVEDFYKVGTISKVKQILKLPGDVIRVLVEGISRGRILEIKKEDPYFEALVEERLDPDEKARDIETEALIRGVTESFENYITMSNRIPPDILVSVLSVEEPGRLADIITAHLVLKVEQKQRILEAFDIKERLEILYKILLEELEILEVERKIASRVKKQIDKMQKEYYLREQLKAIQKELGEKDSFQQEIEEYERKIEEANLPEEVYKKAKEELDRLSKMPPGSAESTVSRTYLDWIISLPWNIETEDRIDIKEAQRVLDEDHYGLTKVKERILEYLAVRKLTNSMKGPILCLVGPPGVGKTSLGRSIARAMNRKFVRMSLGGLKDEAEIRGHRRTYIGAIPGRIISSIKTAGSKNPVFLLDEIDKIGTDFRGDPASALLEVLDAEQNHSFVDHYLELPFDLSKVLFITTANTTDTIPRPLLDRMEVIYISGYTEEEKIHIAEKYLIPKQMKEHGLAEKNIVFTREAVKEVINSYTRESGVRNLEREIANVLRKVAKIIVEKGRKRVIIKKKDIETYLGIPKYRTDYAENKHQVGVATGLAWTPVGGDILSIEVAHMPGTGKLVLTGKLGDVMKESAQAGLSYIRARSEQWNIKEDFYKNTDIHIHVPEGAIPKDGPSAGITMTTAMISALTNIPVSKDVAMTGEITLRGRVLPVGGIKEKVLAGYRAGIKTIILPKDNEKDLEEVPNSVKKALKFILVENMDEVLNVSLIKEREQGNGN